MRLLERLNQPLSIHIPPIPPSFKKKAAKIFFTVLPPLLLVVQAVVLTYAMFASETVTHEYSNYALFLFLTALLLLLHVPYIASYIIQAVLSFGLYYLNEYVTASRGRPLHYIDVFCAKDAMNVAGSFSLVFNSAIGIHLGIALLSAAVCIVLYRIAKKKDTYRIGKFIPLIPVALFSVCYTIYMQSWDVNSAQWNEDRFVRYQGLLSALFFEYQNSVIHEPENYSAEHAQQILSAYQADDASALSDDAPQNIILIMNESLADYSLVADTQFTQDPLPNIHALDRNAKTGKLIVNIFGSSTCNSEFEALTGYELAFYPEATMPYVQFNLSDINSFGNDLNALGFRTTPIHGYRGEEYKRRQIYQAWFSEPFLSAEFFSSSPSKEIDKDLFIIGNDYSNDKIFGEDIEYVNRFPSDAECYRHTLDTLQKEPDDTREFVFTLTMQNHAGYAKSTDDYTLKTFNPDYSYPQNAYLTLSSISDEAFADLLDQLSDSPERTVVIMFGDHQPYVSYPFMPSHDLENTTDYAERMKLYTVPYIFWANYDTEWEMPETFSVNYLSAVLKQNCGIPLTAFDRLRLTAMEAYPVLNWHFSMDADGTLCAPEDARNSEIIQDYNIVQYYKLFG